MSIPFLSNNFFHCFWFLHCFCFLNTEKTIHVYVYTYVTFFRNKLLPTENLMDMRRWKRFCFFLNHGSPQGAIISPTCFIWNQIKTENHKNAWPTWHPGFLRVWLFHLVVSSSYLSTFSPSQQRLEKHNDSRF